MIGLNLARLFAKIMGRLFHQIWVVGYSGNCNHCGRLNKRMLFLCVGTYPMGDSIMAIPKVVKTCGGCHYATMIYEVKGIRYDVSKEFQKLSKTRSVK